MLSMKGLGLVELPLDKDSQLLGELLHLTFAGALLLGIARGLVEQLQYKLDSCFQLNARAFGNVRCRRLARLEEGNGGGARESIRLALMVAS